MRGPHFTLLPGSSEKPRRGPRCDGLGGDLAATQVEKRRVWGPRAGGQRNMRPGAVGTGRREGFTRPSRAEKTQPGRVFQQAGTQPLKTSRHHREHADHRENRGR